MILGVPSLGGPELILIALFLLLPAFVWAYVTWRRGGSPGRIAAALLVSLWPYGGFIVGAFIALTTKRNPARS